MNNLKSLLWLAVVLPLFALPVKAGEAAPYTFASDRLTQLHSAVAQLDENQLQDSDAYDELLLLQFLNDLNKYAPNPEAKKGMMGTYQAFSRLNQHRVGNTFPLRDALHSFFTSFHDALAGKGKVNVPALLETAATEIVRLNESLGKEALDSAVIYDAFNHLRTSLEKKAIDTSWSLKKKALVTLAVLAAIYGVYKGVQKGAEGIRWTHHNKEHIGNYTKHLMRTLGRLHAYELARNAGKATGRVLGHAYTFGSGAATAGWRGLTAGNLFSINGPGINPLSWWRVPAKLGTRGFSMGLRTLANQDPRILALLGRMAKSTSTEASQGLHTRRGLPRRPPEFLEKEA